MDSHVTTVLIADDQAMVRYGLALVIDHEPGLTVVAQAGTGREAVEAVREHRPDVVLMDIRMPELDGIAATAEIRADAAFDGTQVIVLTTFDDEEYVLGALRAGAAGFLLKDVTPQELVDAIRRVHDGDSLLDPAVTRTVIETYLDAAGLTPTAPGSGGAKAADRAPRRAAGPGGHPAEDDPQDGDAPTAAADLALARLTGREGDVWRLVAEGLSNREIGQRLGIAEATVKAHVTSLLVKLGVSSRVQAVILAYDVGLATPA